MEYTRDELQVILREVLNMGMTLRQHQLAGHGGDKSGNQLLDEYMDKKFGVIKHKREITVTRHYTKSCKINLILPEKMLTDEALVMVHLDEEEKIRDMINFGLENAKKSISHDSIYYEPI